ncbi:diacylglycerol kinase family protein [Kineosporia sp. NBRC 101731]|uniref:diacylglycerol/lipid kinase family protein n=1 Tax=Kineosporia sp. NBRC 101731 TaxID=3032199 RepID=UPI0024A224D3|nr:diacylglycerol kinase family protein [Kineosporia sp. NBRC 101731]GLY31843.1 diacylglycerol kinase [Kineosporia sp. NBRC 101731]
MTGTVILAVNPVAGAGRGFIAGALTGVLLRRAGLTVHEVTGHSADETRKALTVALRERPDALVVVGGDGMVNLGLNAVAGTEVPLGVVAAGTGNDIARELGLPIRDIESATAVVVRHLHRPVVRDAGRVTTSSGDTHWFLGVLAAGLDALVNERANGWKRAPGRARYALATLRELPGFRPLRYRLHLDGEPEERTSMLVTAANCASYGGGMRVCPDARPDDGLLDVLTVEPMRAVRLLTIFPGLYRGTHVSHRNVEIRRVRHLRIETLPGSPELAAYADGERIGPLPVECEAVPGAIWVLAPEH